jgi:hypothetical protein
LPKEGEILRKRQKKIERETESETSAQTHTLTEQEMVFAFIQAPCFIRLRMQFFAGVADERENEFWGNGSLRERRDTGGKRML